MLNLHTCESIPLPEATVYILEAEAHKSTGFLHLEPHGALERHNRPVEEWLVQIAGTSAIKLYGNDELVDSVVLKRGDTLKIPAYQFHQHTNPGPEESLTSWHFDGDILEVLNALRATLG